MEPQLKKEIHDISLWLKMLFLKEKQNCESLMSIYETTLGKFCLFTAFLEKMSQFG